MLFNIWFNIFIFIFVKTSPIYAFEMQHYTYNVFKCIFIHYPVLESIINNYDYKRAMYMPVNKTNVMSD